MNTVNTVEERWDLVQPKTIKENCRVVHSKLELNMTLQTLKICHPLQKNLSSFTKWWSDLKNRGFGSNILQQK